MKKFLLLAVLLAATFLLGNIFQLLPAATALYCIRLLAAVAACMVFYRLVGNILFKGV